jgi:pheromone shutdown protein TraB
MRASALRRRSMGMLPLWMALFVGMLSLGGFAGAAEENSDAGHVGDLRIVQQFNKDKDTLSEVVKISDREKHAILFGMGITLLILLLTTAVLGIAMGVYGKQVFIAHMVCAGLSVTLALAHSVAAIVWFFPF